MKKEKGFTLIELLAVIVILAILMVIAVPMILNVIENSKKSAAESSIKLVKDAIKTQVTSGSIMDTNFTSDESGCYTFNFDDQTSGNAKELQLKNKENITGSIKYCNGKFFDDTLVFNGIQSSIKNNGNQSNVICKRATILHTENCTQTDSKLYCSGAGYTVSGTKGTTTITYGSLGTKEKLVSGDAFDCDVNGDGEYNSNTERFYYVSDYYNTSTKEFEKDTAVLIYYNNVFNGIPDNNSMVTYDSTSGIGGLTQNYHGPINAKKVLPSSNQWSNISLKNFSRTILTETGANKTTGGTLPSSFSYQGKSSRLLTIQELNYACNIAMGNFNIGELDNCNYLLENTKYSSSSRENWGYWLENALSNSSSLVWVISSHYRNGSDYATYSGGHGVRPVIEVSKSNIEY